ncbi:MAG TPA: hypothetical protein VFF06_14420 [Polyangia bacterium]|nr:hypothetical protein [Polyangia bacterium]
MARIGAWLAVLLCLVAASRVGADSSAGAGQGKARVDAAAKVLAQIEAQYKTGVVDIERVYLWSTRWCDAQRDAKGNLPQSAAREHLKRMQALEALAKARYAAGVAGPVDGAAAEYYRVEAELWVASAK